MFILIKDVHGTETVVRKHDIKRVTTTIGKTAISFTNRKENPTIYVKESVSAFFNKHLKEKRKKK